MMWSGQDFPNITIDDGKIGIGGNFTPAFELEIRGDTDPTARIRATGAASTDDAIFSLVSKAGSCFIEFGDEADTNAGFMQYTSGDVLLIATGAATRVRIESGNLRPTVDNAVSLGSSSLKWSEVFATAGTINTSDRNLKKNIKDNALGLDFIGKLRPVSYEFKDGPKRTHRGLIAQELKAVMDDMGMKESDLAAYRKTTDEVDGKKSTHLGISYTELIPMLITAVQELDARTQPG